MEQREPLLKEFFKYLSNPTLEVETKPNWLTILFNVVRLWSLIFLLSMFFAMVSNFLLAQSGYGEDDLLLNQVIKDYPYLLVFFLIVIWAPISEELGFRLLLRFSPFKWAVGLAFLSLFFVSFVEIPFLPEYLFAFESWSGILMSIIYIISVSTIIYVLLNYKQTGFYVERFFKKHFKIFFYTLTLLFGILHITNYDVDLRVIWYFAPVLVAPQLFLSFLISFVRMRYGFSWAVFSHTLNNLVVIIPLFILLPILNNISLENIETIENFDPEQIALLVLAGGFLLLIFTLSSLSVLSLLYEFLKKRNI